MLTLTRTFTTGKRIRFEHDFVHRHMTPAFLSSLKALLERARDHRQAMRIAIAKGDGETAGFHAAQVFRFRRELEYRVQHPPMANKIWPDEARRVGLLFAKEMNRR